MFTVRINCRMRCYIFALVFLWAYSSSQFVEGSKNLGGFRKTNEAKRGIIFGVHEKIVPLGLSLINELHCLGFEATPIEVYHCLSEDLSPISKEKFLSFENVKVIDVCHKMIEDGTLNAQVARHFKNSWIKPLALQCTKLEEVMILDADTLLLHSPENIWQHEGYLKTGTLFFNSKVLGSGHGLSSRLAQLPEAQVLPGLETAVLNGDTTLLHYFVHHGLPLPSHDVTSKERGSMEPSKSLSESLIWKGMTSKRQDSTMVLWNKKKQKESLKVMWRLMTDTRFKLKFSDGDSDSYWLSCELAGVEYSFSPWSAGAVDGWKDTTLHPNSLCGPSSQYYPSIDSTAKLLFVKGTALLMPLPVPLQEFANAPLYRLHNEKPTQSTSRTPRMSPGKSAVGDECMDVSSELKVVPLEPYFMERLGRRRSHYMSHILNLDFITSYCEA